MKEIEGSHTVDSPVDIVTADALRKAVFEQTFKKPRTSIVETSLSSSVTTDQGSLHPSTPRTLQDALEQVLQDRDKFEKVDNWEKVKLVESVTTEESLDRVTKLMGTLFR